MKFVIDDKIPHIREAAGLLADEVVYAPGAQFTPDLVRDADALIVRTRTRCHRALLEGSRVRFIATATIGFDHIDTDFCRQAGIRWENAPGCNAASVEQYVQSALWQWSIGRGTRLKGLTIGIVGVGHVGSRIARMAREEGMYVLLNDPPRAAAEGSDAFVGLGELAEKCDIISFHVPLQREGGNRTFHLADEDFFRSLRRNPLIINTSRGEVVDTRALSDALTDRRIADAVIDVWEHEPDIDRTLLKNAYIGTPHIAGYSADGKANATRMALDAVCRFFRLSPAYRIEPPPPPQPLIEARSREEALLRIYNPMNDSLVLKAHPERFEQLRGNYPLRREAGAYDIRILTP